MHRFVRKAPFLADQSYGDYAKVAAESLLRHPNCDPDIINLSSTRYLDSWLIDLIYHHPKTPPSVTATNEEELDLPHLL